MKPTFSLSAFIASFTSPHPMRDWLITLSLLAVLFLAVVIYAGYLFVDIRWGDIAATEGNITQPKQSVTKASLDSVIQKYQARQSAFESRSFNLPKLADPAQ